MYWSILLSFPLIDIPVILSLYVNLSFKSSVNFTRTFSIISYFVTQHKQNKSPAPHSVEAAGVSFSVCVVACSAGGYIMQLVTPSVVPMAVRMVTSVWMMVFQIVFLSISLIEN